MPRRVLRGRVLRKSHPKGCVVVASRRKKDPRLGKIYSCSKNYHVHDEHDEASVGDWVDIQESRPHSRLKRWSLKAVVSRPLPVQVPVEEVRV